MRIRDILLLPALTLMIAALPGARQSAAQPDEGDLLLIYDAHSLTLVNQGGAFLDLSQITFAAVDAPRVFEPSRVLDSLADGACLQIWSINRLGGVRLSECAALEWVSSSRSADHFWIATPTSSRFTVSVNGETHAICPADDLTLAQRRCAVNLTRDV